MGRGVLMAGPKLSEIRTPYMNLWRRFVDACQSQSLDAVSEPDTGPVVKPEKNGYSVSGLMLLKSWPYKANKTRDKRVDIVIKLSETFSSDPLEIVRANTSIGYYKRTR